MPSDEFPKIKNTSITEKDTTQSEVDKNEDWKKFKNKLKNEPKDVRDLTGGEHGGVYTETYKISETLAPAFEELNNRFFEKKGDTKPQRRCKRLLQNFEKAGFRIEMLDLPEASKLRENTKKALLAIYSLKLESVASTQRFVNENPYFSWLSNNTLRELRDCFPGKVTYVYPSQSFESKGLMTKAKREALYKEFYVLRKKIEEKWGKETDRYDIERRLSKVPGYGKYIKIFQINNIKDEFLKKELEQGFLSEHSELTNETLLLAYLRSQYKEPFDMQTKPIAESGKVDKGEAEELNKVMHLFGRIERELEESFYRSADQKGTEFINNPEDLNRFKESILPKLLEAASILELAKKSEEYKKL